MTTEEKFDASRRGIWRNPPLLNVSQTVSQTLSNATLTPVTFTNVIIDNYGGYSTGSSSYTVQVAGWYWITIQVQFASSATGVRVARAVLNGSGSAMLVHAVPANASQVLTPIVSGPIQCAVSDVVTVQGYQNSGGNLGTQVTGGYNSSWSMEWLRLP